MIVLFTSKNECYWAFNGVIPKLATYVVHHFTMSRNMLIQWQKGGVTSSKNVSLGPSLVKS